MSTTSDPRAEPDIARAPPPPSPGRDLDHRHRLTRRHAEAALLLALLAVAALLRLWDLHSRPGTDWDEPVYTDVARSFAHGHGIEAKPAWGDVTHPYLYHPPFYFVLLGGWMRLLGSYEIGDARTLAAIASLVVLGLLYLLLRPRWGVLGAAVALLVLATDGWLIFTNRVGWIENSMLVLLIGGLLAYDQAWRRESQRLFLAAGLLLAGAAAFKHIGVYGIGVVAVHWALTRRQRRGHVVFFSAAGAVIVAYIAVMLVAFARHGHNYFVEDSRVQFERLLGVKQSRGSVGSVRDAFDALLGPYKIFAATLVLATLGGVLVAWRAVAGLLRRDLLERVADPLLFAWALVSILFFAALRLKMGHYFVMVQVPLMLYAFAELAAWARRLPRRQVARRVVGALALIALAANAWTFNERFVQRTDDALGQTSAYARTLPADATVLTEESIGTIIGQPYCKLYNAGACVADVDYVAIYRSRTQRPPRNATLDRLLLYSTPIQRFDGFKEHITIYRAAGPGPVCRSARQGLGSCRLGPAAQRWVDDRNTATTVAHLSFGNYRRLREQRDLRPLERLRDAAGRSWALFLGVDDAGTAAFANLGHAIVSGNARCQPTPANCQLILLRDRQAAHLEVPRIDGRTMPLELKIRSIAPMRQAAQFDRRGAALLRAATTPRTLPFTVPVEKDTQ